MNTLFESLRAFGRKIVTKIAIAGLIGFSLWSLSAPAHAVPYQKGDRGIQSTERYDQIQSEKGGMNNFDAVDPRRNTTTAEAKARELSDVAERRNKRASDPLEPAREAIDELQTKAARTADNLTDSIKNAASDLGDD
ncbi:MAG: hypothetical protein AAFP20_09970 [Cyanobacteria bacterium J06614_10]